MIELQDHTMNTYHYHVIIQISTTVYKRTSPLTTRFCCLEFPKSFCDERLVGIKACQNLVGRISFTTDGFEPAITSMLVNIQVRNTQSEHMNHVSMIVSSQLCSGILQVYWCVLRNMFITIITCFPSLHTRVNTRFVLSKPPKDMGKISRTQWIFRTNLSVLMTQPMGFWKTMSQSRWFEPVRRKSTHKGNCPQYPRIGIYIMKHVCTSNLKTRSKIQIW